MSYKINGFCKHRDKCVHLHVSCCVNKLYKKERCAIDLKHPGRCRWGRSCMFIHHDDGVWQGSYVPRSESERIQRSLMYQMEPVWFSTTKMVLEGITRNEMTLLMFK